VSAAAAAAATRNSAPPHPLSHSYLFGQLLPWCRNRSGFLLVLGSANVDEGLRGYMTKCVAARERSECGRGGRFDDDI
jgi:hypothetical protein